MLYGSVPGIDKPISRLVQGTIPVGTKAPQAAGVIHSDIERGFIRAEIYRPEDLKEAKTEAALKAQGKIRVEGKDYVVQDGDVANFRFNV